jgi:hypothetical protein
MPPKAETIIEENPARLAMTAANIFAVMAKNCVTKNGRFIVDQEWTFHRRPFRRFHAPRDAQVVG